MIEPLYIETNRYCSKVNEPGCSGPGAVFIEILKKILEFDVNC